MLQILGQQDPLPTAFITVRHRQQEVEEGYQGDEKSLGASTENGEVVPPHTTTEPWFTL